MIAYKKVLFLGKKLFLFSHNQFIFILIPSKEKNIFLMKNYPIVFMEKPKNWSFIIY